MTRLAVLAAHLTSAKQQLGRALHYHRFFGQPIDGFSPEHNAARLRINERTVACYAREAGAFACHAGVPPLSASWFDSSLADSSVASAALSVPSIYEHFVAGYVDAQEDLGEATVPMRRVVEIMAEVG